MATPLAFDTTPINITCYPSSGHHDDNPWEPVSRQLAPVVITAAPPLLMDLKLTGNDHE